MDDDYNYLDYSDEDLALFWNYLETCKLTAMVEIKMDSISVELHRRGVVAWNQNGEITSRN